MMDMDQALLESLVAEGGIRSVFHPIYEITADKRTRLWAVEALARGPAGTGLEQAAALFEFVRRMRAEPTIDRACIESALSEAKTLPGLPAVTVNVHASTLGRDPEFILFLSELVEGNGFTPDRIIIEVVEQVPSWDQSTFRRNIDQLRSRGFRLALDDLGVRHSNLQLMLEVRPHVLKIEGAIVRGCHADYYRWALVEWAHMLATRLGAWSLAEGIEDQADLAAATACGIRLVQGHVFCRAMSAAELALTDHLARSRLVLSELPVEAA
jgi:EAL domain-containing protein (putative c-di-GMP-specific phosphodiesterase class I)